VSKKKAESAGSVAKLGAAPASGKLSDPNAIIAAVKAVSLDEKHVQQLIDFLLNKQQATGYIP
jgi:hypothetical protein